MFNFDKIMHFFLDIRTLNDILVVGAGSGGSVVAGRLAEAGHKGQFIAYWQLEYGHQQL